MMVVRPICVFIRCIAMLFVNRGDHSVTFFLPNKWLFPRTSLFLVSVEMVLSGTASIMKL